MLYSQQAAVKTRFDFDTVAAVYAELRRAERKRLARLRLIKRVLHFFGFLCYWAIFAAIGYLVLLAVVVVFIGLS